MRFLIFNLAVGAALVYLIAGPSGDAARAPGNPPEKAAAAAGKVAAAASEQAGKIAPAAPVKEAAPKAPALAPASNPKPESAKAVAPKSAAAASDGVTPPAVPEAKYVAARPVHQAPAPGTTDSPGLARPADPAVARRQAEVLGTGARAGRFAVPEGEVLMTADERYRELTKLVDDMEVLYVNSLGN